MEKIKNTSLRFEERVYFNQICLFKIHQAIQAALGKSINAWMNDILPKIRK